MRHTMSGHVRPRCMRKTVLGRNRRTALRVEASTQPPGTKYDYVIVGGGTAGCVLANKLSADSSKKVVVLEAGQNSSDMIVRVPAGLTRLFKNPVLDWGLNTMTQMQLDSREVYLARGKLLGGSSCTNATLYFRGSAQDYDSWGLDGWGSKDMLGWFKLVEDYAGGANEVHGSGGAMKVEQPRYQSKLHDAFFEACKNKGFPENPDFNDWSKPQVGYGEFQVTQQRAERADMNRQYLKPVMKRDNLEVISRARTTKIHVDKGAARAVDFTVLEGPAKEKRTVELAPGGEVLLCAGAVHSPQVLQLSGIGPASTLSDLGIPVVADLPGVGQNLQDHPACVTSFKLKPEYDAWTVTTQVYNEKLQIRKRALLNYLLRRRGPLTTTACDHGAFFDTNGSGQSDLQIRFAPGLALDPDGPRTFARFGELDKHGFKWPPGITFQLLAVRARSKGKVTLKSTDAFASPGIDIGYFTDPEGADMATMKAAVRLSRELAQLAPFDNMLEEEYFPGMDIQSDSDVEEYICRTVHSGNALVGTCKMGSSASEGAVVSSKTFKVFGVDSLRVVDASVLPRITGGQTGAPTVVVAERAAALLAANQSIGGVSTPTPALA